MFDEALPRRGFLAVGAVLAASLATAATAGAANPDAVAASHRGQQPAQWGVDLAGILTGLAVSGKQIAFTFDACGGPGNNDVDENLLSLLVAQRIPATLFLNRRWIDANQARAGQLAANPLFELANHGSVHKPLSVNGRAAYGLPGTGSPQEAVDEVWANHERLTALTGRAPRFFRAGTAHYDEVAVAIVRELGETPVGYTVNADSGATAAAAAVKSNVVRAQPGAICLAHMHRPNSGTSKGMYAAIPELRAAGFEFVHLP